MEHRHFSIGPRGRVIRGMAYIPGDTSRRQPTVVMMHGFTGNRIENGFLYVQLARLLAQSGINAITFDFRGSGESDGRFEEMLVTEEVDDAHRVLSWTRSQSYVDRQRIGVIGFSLGGLVAACVSNGPVELQSLVLLAPTTVNNLNRHAKQAMDKVAGPQITVGPHRLHPNFFNDLQTLKPLQDVIARPRPTLLVQGTADTAVPPAVSDEYVDAIRTAGVELEYRAIEGAGHTFASPSVRDQLFTHVTDFVTGTLCNTSTACMV